MLSGIVRQVRSTFPSSGAIGAGSLWTTRMANSEESPILSSGGRISAKIMAASTRSKRYGIQSRDTLIDKSRLVHAINYMTHSKKHFRCSKRLWQSQEIN